MREFAESSSYVVREHLVLIAHYRIGPQLRSDDEAPICTWKDGIVVQKLSSSILKVDGKLEGFRDLGVYSSDDAVLAFATVPVLQSIGKEQLNPVCNLQCVSLRQLCISKVSIFNNSIMCCPFSYSL